MGRAKKKVADEIKSGGDIYRKDWLCAEVVLITKLVYMEIWKERHASLAISTPLIFSSYFPGLFYSWVVFRFSIIVVSEGCQLFDISVPISSRKNKTYNFWRISLS